MPWHR